MKTATIEVVAVAGTGTMGRSIAEWLTLQGVRTLLWGRSEASIREATERIAALRRMGVRRKKVDPEAAERAEGLLASATAPEALTEADLLLETVVEDLAAKREVIGALAPALGEGAWVASNTSSLRVAEIAEAAPDPARCFGLHFMNPVPAVNLVELTFPDAVDESTRETARAFCTRIGRQAVETADREGFIVNRLLMLLVNEAARMVEEGLASPADIDKAMRLAAGHPMGPASLGDFIGLDTVLEELRVFTEAHGPRYAPAGLLPRLVGAGRLGRKTGGGLLQARPGAGPV